MRTVPAPELNGEPCEAELVERARTDPHAFGLLYEHH